MHNSISIKMRATDEQVLAYNRNCDQTEALFAGTLANRISGMSADEAYPFIVDWFKSVRQMAVAHHITSGIQFEVTKE